MTGPGVPARERLRRACAAAACVMTCLAPGAGLAQQPDEPVRQPRVSPYAPLLAGAEGDSNARRLMSFWLSASGDYSATLTPLDADAERLLSRTFADSLFHSGTTAQVSYARRGARGAIRAASAHSWLYYPDWKDLSGVTHSARVQWDIMASERWSLQGTQSASYSPFYGIGLLTADISGSGANPLYDISRRRTLVLATRASLNARVTRRVGFSTEYDRQQLVFTSLDRSFVNHGGGAGIESRLSRAATLRARYSEHKGDSRQLYSEGAIVNRREVESGIDYGRLSRSGRRVTLGVAAGFTHYTIGGNADSRMLASARIQSSIANGWTATAGFRRALEWVPGFAAPAFSNQLLADADGALGRRVQLTVSLGYSNGVSGAAGERSRIVSYTNRARARFAITRLLALDVESLYYHYAFGADVALVPGMPRALDRHTVRVGTELLLPLIR